MDRFVVPPRDDAKRRGGKAQRGRDSVAWEIADQARDDSKGAVVSDREVPLREWR